MLSGDTANVGALESKLCTSPARRLGPWAAFKLNLLVEYLLLNAWLPLSLCCLCFDLRRKLNVGGRCLGRLRKRRS